MKLKLSKKGDTFAIVREKNDKGYWDWKDISTQTAPVGKPVAQGSSTYTKPTYETPEERMQKQIYIIRQSSLDKALVHLAGKDASLETVAKTADFFVDYVLQKRVQDMTDDVPE